MTENTRYQTAKACAGEAMDAVFSVYWADSFDADLLEMRLAEIIHFFTRNARRMEEPINSDAPESLNKDALVKPLRKKTDPLTSDHGYYAEGGRDVI